MKKVIGFGASNSRKSINKKLTGFALEQLNDVETELLDLNDYELPLFGVDLEAEIGHPEAAHRFLEKIQSADGLIISFAEHNGAYTAAYKNLFDWCSRIQAKFYGDTPMLLLSTSDGKRGAQTVLGIAYDRYSRSNPNVVGKFSLPSFYDNFSTEKGISEPEKRAELLELIESFRKQL